MNQVIENIYSRRAVRKFQKKNVDREIIEQIIDAGRMAPSAINKQPWKFYIVTDAKKISEYSHEAGKAAAKAIMKKGLKGLMKTLTDAAHFAHPSGLLKSDHSVFHGAPVVIFITAPKDNEWAALDVGMCSQNIMLAAKSFGLDTCPVGLGIFIEQTDKYEEMRIPENEHILISIVLGYGDEHPPVHERIKNNLVYLNTEN